MEEDTDSKLKRLFEKEDREIKLSVKRLKYAIRCLHRTWYTDYITFCSTHITFLDTDSRQRIYLPYTSFSHIEEREEEEETK